MLRIGIQHMRRTDKQVYAIIQEHKKIHIKELRSEADLSQRGLLRVLSRLRDQKLIRGIREGRNTVYEPIPE